MVSRCHLLGGAPWYVTWAITAAVPGMRVLCPLQGQIAGIFRGAAGVIPASGQHRLTGLSGRCVMPSDQTSDTTGDAPGARARPRRSSPRERLLKAADELFYADGVHSVGIDRVL